MSKISKRYAAAVLVTTAAVVVALASAFSVAAVAATAKSLSRTAGTAISTPAQVGSGQAKVVGAASSGQHLRLTLGLKTPHPAEEDALVASLKDKSSPNFRHFLTAAQWNARFAPSAKNEQAVVSWARSQGFTVTKRYANRLVVDLDGTVGTAEKAFGLKINNYRLGKTSFYSNDRSVSLPSKISNIVQSVSGLNSLQQLKPTNTQSAKQYPAYSAGPARQTGPSARANGSKTLLAKAMAVSKAKLSRANSGVEPQVTNGFYDPTDIYSDQAYSVDALNAQGHCCNPTHAANVTPPATSIAIATVGAHNASDIAGFHNQYPYLAYHYQEFSVDGTPACCDDEGTLDLEWSTAMANSFGSFVDTAMVYMYDGANASLGTFTDIWNDMLSDGHARTMTSSWGCAESYCYDSGTMNTDHSIFNSMLGQGWTLMSASDDKGAFADCSHVSVEYPASDPDVLSAGGTNLHLSGGTFSSETAWIGGTAAGSCASNNGGGGGGCSVQWALPSYQSGLIQNLCTTRAEPDFSLNAGIGQNYYFDGGLHGVGGTSIVSPELAGIWAQINAYLGSFPSTACSGGCTTVGQANYDVYNALAGGEHDPFYDITSGCTTNDAGGGYCGIVGYDRATGLGSANLFQLATQVLWFNVGELTPPTVTFSGPGSGYHNGGTITWSIVDGGSPAPTGVAGYTARWDSDPGNPTTEPHGGSGNYFWDGPANKNATSGSVSVASSGQGCHTLYVRAWDNIGDSALNTFNSCFDNTAPTPVVPAASFELGSQVTKAGIAVVRISWSGTDNLSGIQSYQLYKSVNGGTYTPVTLGSPNATSVDQNWTPGRTFRYALAATDNAGNMSSYVYTPTLTMNLVEDNGSGVTYSSGWSTQTGGAYTGGHLEYTTAANNSVKFVFTGRKVAWVGVQGPARGSAKATLDATNTTVNTNAAANKVRVIVYAPSSSNGSHTLVLHNFATSGNPRIDVDAFLVIS